MLKSNNAVINRINNEAARNLCILAEKKTAIKIDKDLEALVNIIQSIDGPDNTLGAWAEVIHYACECKELGITMTTYLYWLRHRVDPKTMEKRPNFDLDCLNGSAYRARDIWKKYTVGYPTLFSNQVMCEAAVNPYLGHRVIEQGREWQLVGCNDNGCLYWVKVNNGKPGVKQYTLSMHNHLDDLKKMEILKKTT